MYASDLISIKKKYSIIFVVVLICVSFIISGEQDVKARKELKVWDISFEDTTETQEITIKLNQEVNLAVVKRFIVENQRYWLMNSDDVREEKYNAVYWFYDKDRDELILRLNHIISINKVGIQLVTPEIGENKDIISSIYLNNNLLNIVSPSSFNIY